LNKMAGKKFEINGGNLSRRFERIWRRSARAGGCPLSSFAKTRMLTRTPRLGTLLSSSGTTVF
jgi:hypothetical protein